MHVPGTVVTCIREIESKEAKDCILRVVAHDLRAPISGIASFSQLMIDNPGRTEEERNYYLRLIHQTSTELMALINELLQGHADDAAGLKLDRIDMNMLAQHVTKLLQLRLLKNNCSSNCCSPASPHG